MQTEAIRIPARDGTGLHVRCHRPDEPAGRNLLVAHGASEHGGRYDHFARFLTDRGWNVVIPDHRGHGRSDGVPMFVDDFDEYAHDLEAVRECLGLEPERTIVFGHSMGGLIAIRHAQCHPERSTAVAVSSPLLGIRVAIPAWKLALGHAVRWVHPRYVFETEVRIEDTTRGLEAIERRRNDPLMHNHVTAGWFFAMRDGIARGWRDAADITSPILVMQAGADLVVDPDVVEPWLETVHSNEKTFRLFEGQYHELHNEPEWQENLTFLADWLDLHLPVDETGDADAFVSAIEKCRCRSEPVLSDEHETAREAETETATV